MPQTHLPPLEGPTELTPDLASHRHPKTHACVHTHIYHTHTRANHSITCIPPSVTTHHTHPPPPHTLTHTTGKAADGFPQRTSPPMRCGPSPFVSSLPSGDVVLRCPSLGTTLWWLRHELFFAAASYPVPCSAKVPRPHISGFIQGRGDQRRQQKDTGHAPSQLHHPEPRLHSGQRPPNLW